MSGDQLVERKAEREFRFGIRIPDRQARERLERIVRSSGAESDAQFFKLVISFWAEHHPIEPVWVGADGRRW